MATVTIQISGNTKTIECTTEQTIFDAAENAGVDIPVSCMGGSCGACEADLISGKVEMDNHSVLTDDELSAGKILACQAKCTTDSVEISFAD